MQIFGEIPFIYIMGFSIDFLFNLRVFTFWFDTEKALFQVILDLL